MNPQDDDPEARIRALEQPLAGRAQPTELGTTPYTSGGAYTGGGAYQPPPVPPMPPPVRGPDYGAQYTPPGYGAPWAPPPRKVSAGIPWVVLGIGAVVFMAVAAGVGFYIVNKSTRDFPIINIPSISVPSFPARHPSGTQRPAEHSGRRTGEHRDRPATGWAAQRRRRWRDQDDRVQRQQCEHQRRLQHRHDHRPLHGRHGVGHAEQGHARRRPTRSTRRASTTWSPTTPARRTSIPADPTWSSRAELSRRTRCARRKGEREHGALVGERCSRHEKHLPFGRPLGHTVGAA